MRSRSSDALRKEIVAVGLIGAALALVPLQVAHGHGVLEKSTPDDGAHLADPPQELSISFTEPPTGDAVVEVTDGCNRDVLEDMTVSGGEIRGGLSEGLSGRWRVNWKIISAVDGHTTRGRFAFVVAGRRDCSGDPTVAAPAPPTADGTDFPWLPFAAASVAVIGVAAVARVITSPRKGHQVP
ncbi:MAG: copper resistance CopC family protein [Actinomycetota bacterium]